MQIEFIYDCIPSCVHSCVLAASRYTGKERDAESGLDYFGARYYSSTMGRWTSPDPSMLEYADQRNPQSLNLYSYVLNNPLRNVDPNGMYCYYGSTDADVGDNSQYDMHSTVSECTQADENGNKGQWVDDPHTDVNVSANGDGSIDSFSSSFDGTTTIPYEQYSQWKGDPDDKRIQTLSQDITVDVQQERGCIAQAYGVGGPATTAFQLGQPVSGTKRFVSPGSSLGTSPISDTLSKALPVKGSFRAPIGGPGTGVPFRMTKTGNLGRAIGRWTPFVAAAADIYAAAQLWNCLGGK
jgi:RHS repeat-associated protein